MFASIELARRIDGAEARLAAAYADAARRMEPALETIAEPIGGGLAVYAGPGAPANKVAGLGFDGPLDEAVLRDVESRWCALHAPLQVELSSLAHPEVAAQLTSRGFVLRGFEDVLGLSLGAAAIGPGPPGIEVRFVEPEDGERWIEILLEGFLHPDGTGTASIESFDSETIRRIYRQMRASPEFPCYLAFVDGQPAGGGGLRKDAAGVAQLCGAATVPRFRRRGVQTALLQKRLTDSAQAGCDIAVVTTAPGSASQANVRRQGFSLLYTRAVLVKDWPAGQ